MTHDKKDITVVFEGFKRYRLAVVAIVFATTSIFVGTAFVLPKSYKSNAVISIYMKYFQNPLVKDFVSETYDSGELRSQRETLLRLALDDNFIDVIGEKYGILKSPPGSNMRSAERQFLQKRFELVNLNSTSYQIGFVGGSPDVAFSIVKDAIEQITKTLMSERKKNLVGLRDVIGARIEALGLKLGKDPAGAASRETIQKEIDGLTSRVTVLRMQYTDVHPEIERLKRRIEQLTIKLEQQHDLNRAYSASLAAHSGSNFDPEHASADPAAEAPRNPDSVPATAGIPNVLSIDAAEVTPEIYHDLVKKYGYLSILMETEKDSTSYFAIVEPPRYPIGAIFPKKKFFLIWGILAGIFISFAYVLVDSKWRLAMAGKKGSVGNLPSRSKSLPAAAMGRTPERKAAKIARAPGTAPLSPVTPVAAAAAAASGSGAPGLTRASRKRIQAQESGAIDEGSSSGGLN